MSEPEKKEQRRPCSPEMLTPSMLLNDVSHLIRNKMRREGEASRDAARVPSDHVSSCTRR